MERLQVQVVLHSFEEGRGEGQFEPKVSKQISFVEEDPKVIGEKILPILAQVEAFVTGGNAVNH